MEEKKECGQCRYRVDGKCVVPLWCNGKKIMLGSVPENGHCELWEKKDDESNE